MAHISVVKGRGSQQLDGFTLHEGERVNVDVTLPLVAAAITAGNVTQEDSAAVPAARGGQILVKSGAVSDADFSSPPPVGTPGYDKTGHQLYIKESANPSVWKKSAAYT